MAFELWKTLKESSVADADLSLASFVILVVALGVASAYVVLAMFGSSPQRKRPKSSDHEEEVVKDIHEVSADTTSSQVAGDSSSTWDVFLSFRGKDTRHNFISHLYYALDQAGIRTFRDEPALDKGEEISPALINAIRNSKMFVVVISENYAESRWCLDELVEILSCKRTRNQVVPAFYYVNPSDLRHPKGSFGRYLRSHEKRHSVNMIEKWKSSLAEIADLSGYHLKKEANESEADTIQKIVENVRKQAFSKVLHLEGHLCAIDIAVEEIYEQLSMDSNDVRALGICGMGGIGKTTTAKAFYNKYSHQFDKSCFIENVKQNSQGHSPLLPLLQQLLIELLRVKDYEVSDVESALRKLKEILNSKKALVVLDDLDQSSYSELLVRICKLFSHGSRVIITARDANLLNQLKVEMSKVDTFFVKHLNETNSLELFSYHAFKRQNPPMKYLALSESFVTYTGGLPLALKVLGSSLSGRTDVSFWKAKLEKIQKIPVENIQKILQLSYDELDDEMIKAIFLDIVFFFVGKNIDEAVHVFDSSGFFPNAGIPILVERCLLEIDEHDRLRMHNLIQDMGKKVIRQESKYGKCQRLYLDQEEAHQSLQNLQEFEKIEGVILDFTLSTNKYCNGNIFKRLPNLRLLRLIDVHGIKGDLETSFNELRAVSWHNCPWMHLPSTIYLPKLVSLDVSFSRFKTLWKDAKLPSLRYLNLEGCQHLEELPESIGQSTKLDHFDVSDCVNLQRLPKPITQLTTLSHLHMHGCSNLKVLPEQLGDMKCLKMLDASFTAIEQLPDSIALLNKLVHLNLSFCRKFGKLPEQFGNMEGLKTFDASYSGIEQLPDSFSNLPNLVGLTLSNCENLTSLPNDIWMLKCLRKLDLRFCLKLKRLPEQFGKMQCLNILNASNTAIEEIPDSIGLLRTIQILDFGHCKTLTYVPSSIFNLTSLELLQFGSSITRIELLDAVNSLKSLSLCCNIRVWLPMILSCSSLTRLQLYDECRSLSPTIPFSFCKLFNLQHLTLFDCTSHGSSFPELPLSLITLSVHNHASLEQVPDLSHLKQLKRLYIRVCRSLQSLQKLPPHLSTLQVCDCKSLQNLPDLSVLRDLEQLEVTGNGSTLKVSLKESHLQVRRDEWSSFNAILQNGEIPEWFDYRTRGSTVSFDIPSILGDSVVGVSLRVVCEYLEVFPVIHPRIKASITNKTEDMTHNYTLTGGWIDRSGCTPAYTGVRDVVKCTRVDDISIKSGDRIEVSFQTVAPDFECFEVKAKVKMCGVHLILQPPCNSFPL